MPFDLHNRDRICHLIEEMAELRYKNLKSFDHIFWYEDNGTTGNRTPVGEPVEIEQGFRWKGWDQYNWLCTRLTVPAELMEEEVVGIFDFGVPEGTGNNSHFESLLYLNGKPYQGVDGNHKEVFFQVKENGALLDLKFRLWSGLNGGGVPKDMAMELVRAQYGVLDHDTDNFYFLARNVLETYDILDSGNEYREWMLNMLVKAFGFVDYTEPGTERFYDSIRKAYEYLNGKMKGQGKPDIQVSMLGHTHIDVAWLWRLRHTREKAARSFSTVNRMMDHYDHYHFLQSQAQLYEFIKEDYPDIYDSIKRRVKEGKWEPAGAMWVECDCNLASGESIVRQILVGKNFFQEEFEYESEFLWLPDVFGYSWALPQILKKAGVEAFMTTKISWNDTNRLPFDTFLWKGIDGTEITAHFVTTTDQDSDSYTYNGDTRPYAVKGVWDNYKNKDLNRDLLISYGYGDGGGGPNRDMIETLKHLNKIPGLPKVQFESATEYFRRLRETAERNEMEGNLPVWDGELYLEFHRGTYTSQAYNKKMNRKMEFYLRDTEIRSVLAKEWGGIAYDRDRLQKAWKIVLCQQFHDILPGSSIREVYEDSHVEYEKACQLLAQVEDEISKALYVKKSGVYTVWNNSNWKRTTIVRISETSEGDRFRDENGQLLYSYTKDGVSQVLVKDMAPFSFVTLYRDTASLEVDHTGQDSSHISTQDSSRQAETSYYRVAWNEWGQLTEIYDKEAGRDILSKGKRGNVLQVFEDKPRCFDAWELEPTYGNKMEEIRDLKEVCTEVNPLGIWITFSWDYHKSTISQTMCLYHEKKRIDFKTRIIWEERQKLLKTAFPVGIRSIDARFDIQYGNIRRRITRNDSWEAARFEVVAHKWMDFSETGYGVALLNDCKYGHDIYEDTMRLTLIKSATDPDYAADLGLHEFTYSLYPHREEWYDSGLEQESFDLNNPITAVSGAPKITSGSLFHLDSDYIASDCIKQAEHSQDIVLRFHEFAGARVSAVLTSALKISSWCQCDLMERPTEDFKSGPVSLEFTPYEIKTILVRFK